MRKRSIAPLILLLGASAGAAQESAPAGAEAAPRPPIIIDSESNRYDMRAGVNRFEGNVTIARGPMRVNADEGTVRQADGRITEIELLGSPTTWRDRLDDGTLVEGEAERIHFDVIDNIVTLTGNARLEHERGEYTGDELTYDLDTESLAGRATGDGNRVRVILEPEAVDDGASAIANAGEEAAETGSTGTAADETHADDDPAASADETGVDPAEPPRDDPPAER